MNKVSKSVQPQQRFFDAFPASFNEFSAIYGFDYKASAAPNYQESTDHISFFFTTAAVVGKTQFANKLIGIANASKWDADCVSMFQDKLINHILHHPKPLLNLLQQRPQKQIYGFCYFLNDRTDKSNERNFTALQKLLQQYPVVQIEFVRSADDVREVIKHH